MRGTMHPPGIKKRHQGQSEDTIQMKQPKMHQTAYGPVLGVEARLDEIGEWAPKVTQVRETLLHGVVVGTSLFEGYLSAEAMAMAPSQDDVDRIAATCEVAVRAGRLIDFGDWTNDVIKHGGNRGGPLYSRGAIGHPFGDPYVFLHTWEGATSVYMVNPLEPDKLAGGDCECLELQPLRIQGEPMLMIADRALLEGGLNADKATWSKYHCSAMPSPWRFLPGVEGMNNGIPPANAAAGNVLDPLMCALLILSTRGIERRTITVSEKLQKARRKNGKPPIPPYDQVLSAPYVTAIMARRARGRHAPRGGTHASPIPHLRMGHPRILASGVQTFVRDALVAMTDDAKKAWAGRSHYAVKA